MSQHFVSRYKLKEEIGRGGMGSVYRAFDEQLQRHVAIKVLPPEDVSSSRPMARFEREARAASSLNHPNICTIHDFGEHEGAPFIVMELVEGRPLDKVLQSGPLPVDRVTKIGIQLAEGLQAAHDRGIVHRDIKPANVILSASDVPKILDFGIAKFCDNDQTLKDDASLTQAGGLLGTMRYLSPEQALGKNLNGRSDLFSLGLLLYEMLSGENPFQGNTQVSRINSLLHETPAPLKRRDLPIPPRLDRLIRRLLEKDPERRPANARAVAETLRLCQEPKAGANRWLLAAGAVLLTVTLTLLLIWWQNLPRASPEGERNLALLPLNYSGPANNQPNATMLPALLAEALRSNSSLAIAPFDTSRQYSPESDPEQARQELGVAWLLAGEMSVTEPLYTVRLRLTGSQGKPIWSNDYRGEVAEIFSIAGQISADVAEALGEDSLSGSGLLGLDRTAVRFYLEGKRFLEGWDVESNFERARQSFSKAIESDSEFGEAYAGLARSLWRAWEETGDARLVEEAQRAAAQAVQSAPAHPEAHLAMGIVQLGRGRSREAVLSFQTAQTLAPADDAVCRSIADAYARLGRASEAEIMYEKAIELRPDVWQNYRAKGNFLLSQGRFEEAKEPYRHIIRLRPQSDIGHNNLALAHLSLGEFNEAEVSLLAAVAIQPTMAGHTNLGFVYYSTSRFREAAEQFIQATRYTQDESPWLNLGDAYRQLGQEERANQAYRQAIRLSQNKLRVDAHDAELRSRLAYSFAGAGDCEEALAEILLTRQENSESPWIAYYSAVAFSLCNREDEAASALVSAVQGGLRADVESNPDLQPLLARPEIQKVLMTAQ